MASGETLLRCASVLGLVKARGAGERVALEGRQQEAEGDGPLQPAHGEQEARHVVVVLRQRAVHRLGVQQPGQRLEHLVVAEAQQLGGRVRAVLARPEPVEPPELADEAWLAYRRASPPSR